MNLTLKKKELQRDMQYGFIYRVTMKANWQVVLCFIHVCRTLFHSFAPTIIVVCRRRQKNKNKSKREIKYRVVFGMQT